jgi:hypothetical protein
VTVDVTAFTATFAVFATFVVAGFVLLFTELRRLETRLETQIGTLNGKFDELRRDLAEEFRTQRAEVLAQTNALATAITAARGAP